MNRRTELTAALTAIMNGVFGLLSAFDIYTPTPELITAVNGVLLPTALIFLGSRVARVEQSSKSAEMTVNRVEMTQSKER